MMTRLLILRLMPLVMVAVFAMCIASIGIGQMLPESWQVLFARQDVEGNWDVYNLDVAHGLFYAMYPDVMFPRIPQVSPDRHFVSYQDRRGVLYVYDAEAEQAQEIAYGDIPTWSPDSRQIAYPYNGYIRVASLQEDGNFSDPQVIVNNHRNDVWSPVWSPDSQQLVFSVYIDSIRQVFMVDADGENLRDLVDERDTDYDPAWSPDGRYIAYASLTGGERDIYIIDLEVGTTELITTDLGNERINNIRWSPDMSHLAFISYRHVIPVLFIIDREQHTYNVPYTMSNISMTWSPDGQQVAYVAPTGQASSSVFVVDVSRNSQPHQVTFTYGDLVILP